MPLKPDGEFDWWHKLPMSMDKYQYDEWCSAGKPVTGPARLARDEEKKVRAIVGPLLEETLRTIVLPEIERAKSDLRREYRSLMRRARLRRWSRKDAERFAQTYVQSLPKASDMK
jgi:hypothetical protein